MSGKHALIVDTEIDPTEKRALDAANSLRIGRIITAPRIATLFLGGLLVVMVLLAIPAARTERVYLPCPAGGAPIPTPYTLEPAPTGRHHHRPDIQAAR